MAFWNFFKGKEKQEIEEESISLNELDSLIKKQRVKYESDIEEIRTTINQSIESLISDLKSKKEALKAVNLNNRKEDERLKRIVIENIHIYITHLDKLINELQDLEKSLVINEYVIKIQHIFNSFKKNSVKSLEKATIFVGREFEQILEIIKLFSKNFNQVITENNEKFEQIPRLDKLSDIKQEYDHLIKIEDEFKKSIKLQEKREEELIQKKATLEKEHEIFVQGYKFKEYLEELKKQKQETDKFTQRIFNLKEKTNLKFLSKHFHSDEKKSKIILNYQENFIEALEKDHNLEISKLVKEASNIDLENEITSIKKESILLKKAKEHVAEKEKRDLEDRISKAKHELLEIQEQIKEENKKVLRFEEKKKEILSEIENNLNRFSVKLIK